MDGPTIKKMSTQKEHEFWLGNKSYEELKPGLIDPSGIADIYWFLHNQKKSCWTFEMDLRTN